MISLQRRRLLQTLLGAGAARMTGAGVSMLAPALGHASAPSFDDFKVLVVLYQHGGNDSYNMLVPLADKYQEYRDIRTQAGLAVDNTELDCSAPPGDNQYAQGLDSLSYTHGLFPFSASGAPGQCAASSDDAEFGVNGLMPELAGLFRDGDAVAIANMGSLIHRVDRGSLDDPDTRLPPFLYAHNHQLRAMETGWADNLQATGWAGRLADLWLAHAGRVNPESLLGLNVSYGGPSRMMTGTSNRPVVLEPGRYSLFDYSRGFDPGYFGELNAASSLDGPMRRLLKSRHRDSLELHQMLEDTLSDSYDHFYSQGARNSYDQKLFTVPSTQTLGLQKALGGKLLGALGDVAQMIDVHKNMSGVNRLIFFVEHSNYDTHSNQSTYHPRLLRELSLAIGDFQAALRKMEELDPDNSDLTSRVTLCTLSDFGRTMGVNHTGTDHAWGMHGLVVGGAVDGTNRLLGTVPDIGLGGADDTGSKGRFIPSIAVDQYLATIMDWFGVNEDDMSLLFPNLANFQGSAPSLSGAYLQGLFRA